MQIKQAKFGSSLQREIGERGKRKGNFETRQRAAISPLRNRGAIWEPKNYRPPHIIHPSHKYEKYTPLNVLIYQVLMAVHDILLMRRLALLKFPAVGQVHDFFCEFHQDWGHATDEREDLRDFIEDLIQQGYMRQFVH